MKNDELIVNGDFNDGDSGWSLYGPCELGANSWIPMNGSVIINMSVTLYYENRPVRIKKGPGKGRIKMVSVKLTNPIEQITKLKEFKPC